MCLARFGSPATACVDQAEDLSPQSSPFRDAWIGKNVRNKRVSDRVLFPSPAPAFAALTISPARRPAPIRSSAAGRSAPPLRARGRRRAATTVPASNPPCGLMQINRAAIAASGCDKVDAEETDVKAAYITHPSFMRHEMGAHHPE